MPSNMAYLNFILLKVLVVIESRFGWKNEVLIFSIHFPACVWVFLIRTIIHYILIYEPLPCVCVRIR